MNEFTHYIVYHDCPTYVFRALSLTGMSVEARRRGIGEYMADGKRVVACKNGPYSDIRPIYEAICEGEIP